MKVEKLPEVLTQNPAFQGGIEDQLFQEGSLTVDDVEKRIEMLNKCDDLTANEKRMKIALGIVVSTYRMAEEGTLGAIMTGITKSGYDPQ